MEIDYYEFKPVEYNGMKLFAFASATIEYDISIDSIDYPLASAGRRTIRDINIIDIDLRVNSITDENGSVIFLEDEIPTDLYRILFTMFKDHADPVEMVRASI